MLWRIADRGLLFGYLGNKMLSLYEDWREGRFQTLLVLISFTINLYLKILITKQENKYANNWDININILNCSVFTDNTNFICLY